MICQPEKFAEFNYRLSNQLIVGPLNDFLNFLVFFFGGGPGFLLSVMHSSQFGGPLDGSFLMAQSKNFPCIFSYQDVGIFCYRFREPPPTLMKFTL